MASKGAGEKAGNHWRSRQKTQLVSRGQDKSLRGWFLTIRKRTAKGKWRRPDRSILWQELAGTDEFKCTKVCGIYHGRMNGKWIVEEQGTPSAVGSCCMIPGCEHHLN